MKNIIRNYVQNLKKEDIITFCRKNNLFLNNSELNFIYNNLKNNFEYIYDNQSEFLLGLKNNLTSYNYQVLEEYYYKYKDYL
ncbi:MAG: hypothetical protein PHU05_05615 [Bacilli bacterium]|nr:hypothetical protein [Bacilli bacterium]